MSLEPGVFLSARRFCHEGVLRRGGGLSCAASRSAPERQRRTLAGDGVLKKSVCGNTERREPRATAPPPAPPPPLLPTSPPLEPPPPGLFALARPAAGEGPDGESDHEKIDLPSNSPPSADTAPGKRAAGATELPRAMPDQWALDGGDVSAWPSPPANSRRAGDPAGANEAADESPREAAAGGDPTGPNLSAEAAEAADDAVDDTPAALASAWPSDWRIWRTSAFSLFVLGESGGATESAAPAPTERADVELFAILGMAGLELTGTRPTAPQTAERGSHPRRD